MPDCARAQIPRCASTRAPAQSALAQSKQSSSTLPGCPLSFQAHLRTWYLSRFFFGALVDGIWGIWYTICAWIDGHVVGALHFCRDEGDAGEEVGDVVHRLPCKVSQI